VYDSCHWCVVHIVVGVYSELRRGGGLGITFVVMALRAYAVREESENTPTSASRITTLMWIVSDNESGGGGGEAKPDDHEEGKPKSGGGDAESGLRSALDEQG
jgi:hypothetical protein